MSEYADYTHNEPKMNAGYSGTPLAKKLGIKEDFLIVTVNEPSEYRALLGALPRGVELRDSADTGMKEIDLVHLFTNTRDELFRELPKWMRSIHSSGTIWVSWYKRAAKLPTEITEDTVRDAALPLGLVDVKVCAVDEKWSGLKLVIRKENRA
ncbi:MAG TPA: DUF3052 family protein [Pyrinomonadaceae bacterium]